MKEYSQDNFYQEVWQIFPHLPELIEAWQGIKFESLAKNYKSSIPASQFIKNAIYKQITPSLGEDFAKLLEQRLDKDSAVIAANYHSIECFAEMVQDLHFFGLNELRDRQDIHIIPVLACSSIALDSQTFPRGLMLTRRAENHIYQHLPFFANSQKSLLISQAPKIDRLQLENSMQAWKKLPLETWEYKAATGLVEEHILRPKVFELASFSEQVTYINQQICQSRYPESPNTHFVYIDTECLISQVLFADLQDANSVLSRVLFQTQNCKQILQKLVGVKSCWSQELLSENRGSDKSKVFGTVLFWAVDTRGHRSPLRLVSKGLNEQDLFLENDSYILPLKAEAILEALQSSRIIPNLFVVYTSLVLEHNLTCFGGIFMSNYLPKMLSAVIEVLDLDAKPYNALLALPMSVCLRTLEPKLRLAGTIELFAAGGLKNQDLDSIANLTITDVLPMNLREWYYDYVAKTKRQENWQLRIENDSTKWQGVFLENKMI